jgi:PKD domain
VRRSTRAALSAIAAFGVVGTASAAPTAPTLGALPPFVRGSVQVTWTPAATPWTELSDLRSYGLTITPTPPAPLIVESGIAEAAQPGVWNTAGINDGVSIGAWAVETPCAVVNTGPDPDVCGTPGTTPVVGTSPLVTTTVDNTGPAGGSLSINGGAAYTRVPAVTLTATPATDPAGVPRVQLGEGASPTDPFLCTQATDLGCPRDVFTTLPFTISGNADGLRAVRAIYRDGAVTVPATPVVDGNPSSVVTDSIFLDRRAPTAVPTGTPAAVQVGRPVTFGSAGSRDDTNGADDSGLDPAGYTWAFGSGATGTGGGASPTRTYTTAGLKTVTLTVRDRAGNTSPAVNVTVNVTSPPPVVTPPATGGGGTTTGGGTGGGTAPATGGGGGAAPVSARFVARLRPVGRVIEGKQMKIAVEVRGRVIITVSLVKVRANGKLGKVVRTFTGLKSGRFGVRFKAPKAGRYRLVARTGGQRRSSIVTVLPAPVVAVDPQPVPAASK